MTVLSKFGIVAAALLAAASVAQAGTITVTDDSTVAPGSSTCTLAQAIAVANGANGVIAAPIGSITTNTGTCAGEGPGPNTIQFASTVSATQTFTMADNWWYGPNALPPIASAIFIDGTIGSGPTGVTLVASHIGDPTPAAANAFRFFYVSGGLAGELPAGTLVLRNLTLTGGYAKGGDGGAGGGGAGMGGAIFNQGSLQLNGVTITANTAQGGRAGANGSGAGGVGQDAGSSGSGGFGGNLGGSYGDAGATGSSGTSNGGNGGSGGGFSVGSSGGGSGGSGGAGSSIIAGGNGGNGGGFGSGGSGGGPGLVDGGGGGGGGGGVGSGGGVGGPANTGLSAGVNYNDYGGSGGYGGFGGGGGIGGAGGGGVDAVSNGGNGGGGGFGGGGGGGGNASPSNTPRDPPGVGGAGGSSAFGGGDGANGVVASNALGAGASGGGAGMGGAIFNHRGPLSLINVTMTGNTAIGGGGNTSGSGLGGAIFNLNGRVTILFSTLANNSVNGSNGAAGPGDATVYSLAYGNKIEDGTASNATLTLTDSIVTSTTASNGAGNNDVVSLAVNGAQTNTATLIYADINLVGLRSGTSSGPAPLATAPDLGVLFNYGGPTQTMRPLPNSPAIGTANCTNAPSPDQRGVSRPQNGLCDIGAVELTVAERDRIFADNFDGTPTL